MVIADWVAIGIVVVCIALGALIGFGKTFKFFTSKIFAFIIGIIVCAAVGTAFVHIQFIADLMAKFPWEWLGYAVYYIIMFIIVELLCFLVRLIVKALFESRNIVMRVLNAILGAVCMLGIGAVIAISALVIIGWVGGDTALKVEEALAGSCFKLGELYKWVNHAVIEKIPEIPEGALALVNLI